MNMDKASLNKKTNVSLFGPNLINTMESSIFVNGDRPAIANNRQGLYHYRSNSRPQDFGMKSPVSGGERSTGDGHVTTE